MDSVNYKKVISCIRFAASDYIPSHQLFSKLVKFQSNRKFQSKKPEHVYWKCVENAHNFSEHMRT